MSALSPLTPAGLLRAFQRAGYVVLEEGKHNWVVVRKDEPKDTPFIIPRKGRLVGMELMQCAGQHNKDHALLNSIIDEIQAETAKAS